jgi:hypothetical protein
MQLDQTANIEFAKNLFMWHAAIHLQQAFAGQLTDWVVLVLRD